MAKTKLVTIKGSWQEVVDDCRSTVDKPPLGHEPSDEWKLKILISEHEPIRDIWIKWKWQGIKYWIAMHWKTHIWPSRVNTQRTDRTGIDREKKPQDALVNFTGDANLQHLIDTFRKRLCYKADRQTRGYAIDLKHRIRGRKKIAVVSSVLVPNCVYRAGCPEMAPCGHWIKFITDRPEAVGASISERYRIYNEWAGRV